MREHFLIVGKKVLDAVAVMHVKINNGNPAYAMAMPGVFGGDGDIIKQAEAHGMPGFGVMPRRADTAKSIQCLPRKHRVHRCADRTHGMDGGLPRTGRDWRVRV